MEPTVPLIPVIAVVGALLGFAVLVLVGGVIVRRLGLPNDLPDGPRFEPPAPPVVDRADPAQARQTATTTLRRAALGSTARACLGMAMQARERGLAASLVDAAAAAAADAEVGWKLTDLAAAEQAVAAAEARCRAVLATVPEPAAS